MPRPRIPLPDNLPDLYRAGATLEQLAARFGCTVPPIRNALIAAGCERRRPGPVAQPKAPRSYKTRQHDPAEWERVLCLWADGFTSGRIARDTAIPRNSVCRIVSVSRARGDARAVQRRVPRNLVRPCHRASV
jgi:hypothetical protein